MPATKRVQPRSYTGQILWGIILLLSSLFPQLGLGTDGAGESAAGRVSEWDRGDFRLCVSGPP